MQYKVTKGEKGKVEIKVDIPKAQFEQAYSQSLSYYLANSNISGFRPGKAPVDIVEGHIGLTKILNETASVLITKHLAEIFKTENLIPLDSPKIAIGSLAKDSPMSFTASFVRKPVVQLGDWEKIKVKKVKAKEITEEDINQSIKNIHEAWEKDKLKVTFREKTRSKRASEKLKVEGEEETETTDQKSGTKYIYDAHGNKIFFKNEGSPPSHKQSLRSSQAAGLKASEGDSSEGINDNFAKAIGARDLVHLRELVKKDLETIVADQIETKLEQEIFDELLKICQLEVPDLLIDDELNRILIRLNSQLEQQKKTMDGFLKDQNTTIEELKSKWRIQAEKNVKTTLILDQIGKNETVSVQKEEIDQTLNNTDQKGLSEDQKKDLEKYISVSIFQAKTLDLVKKTISS